MGWETARPGRARPDEARLAVLERRGGIEERASCPGAGDGPYPGVVLRTPAPEICIR